MEYEFKTLTCSNCGAEITLKCSIVRGYSDYEMVKCPSCKEDIQEVRADMGYEVIDVLKK